MSGDIISRSWARCGQGYVEVDRVGPTRWQDDGLRFWVTDQGQRGREHEVFIPRAVISLLPMVMEKTKEIDRLKTDLRHLGKMLRDISDIAVCKVGYVIETEPETEPAAEEETIDD
jgi:hypothetical protein